MTPKKITYATLEAIKSAVKSGDEVYWQNLGYEVRAGKNGEFRISCCNGHSSPFSETADAGEFFSLSI
jgi:hypothetical protein